MLWNSTSWTGQTWVQVGFHDQIKTCILKQLNNYKIVSVWKFCIVEDQTIL